MAELISDEMLDAYATVGTWDDIADKLKKKYTPASSTGSPFYVPYRKGDQTERWAKVIRAFNGLRRKAREMSITVRGSARGRPRRRTRHRQLGDREHALQLSTIEPQTLEHLAVRVRSAARDSYPWLVAARATVRSSASPTRAATRCVARTTGAPRSPSTCRTGTTGVASARALYAEMLPILDAQRFHSLVGVNRAAESRQRRAAHERFGFVDAGTTRQVGWKFGRWWDVGHWQKLLRYEDAPASRIVPVEDAIAAARAKGRR